MAQSNKILSKRSLRRLVKQNTDTAINYLLLQEHHSNDTIVNMDNESFEYNSLSQNSSDSFADEENEVLVFSGPDENLNVVTHDDREEGQNDRAYDSLKAVM